MSQFEQSDSNGIQKDKLSSRRNRNMNSRRHLPGENLDTEEFDTEERRIMETGMTH